ncbi:putative helicase [Bartonella silvatica]|uniref:Helicase n=1 Tax=Bartonella silvatica TaxID=357760 RepID=A0ABV2HF48_9HYPH
MPRIFPMGQAIENRMIQVTDIGANNGFSVLISKILPNHDAIEKGQCFPGYVYENVVISKDKNNTQTHWFVDFVE